MSNRVRVTRHQRRAVKRKQADRIERATLPRGAVKSYEGRVYESKTEAHIRGRGGGKVRTMMTVRGGGGAEAEPILPHYEKTDDPYEPISRTNIEVDISRSAWNESMAHTVDQLLGFNIVPPTYLRAAKVKTDVGATGVAVQYWVPGSDVLSAWRHSKPGREGERPNEEDLIKIFLFDMIIGHVDRHSENIVVDPKPPYHAWAVDNENIMESRLRDSTITNVANSPSGGHASLSYIEGREIPKSVLKKIRDLRWEDFVTATAGSSKSAQRAAWERRKEVLNWKTIPTEESLEGDKTGAVKGRRDDDDEGDEFYGYGGDD